MASAKSEPSARFCETQYSKECQGAVSPQQVLERFKKGNERFVNGHGTHRNYTQQVRDTAKGQYPLGSIVSCIDSRAPAELVLDQGIGDVFNARVAGNIVNEDILGSLEFASKVAGSKLIVVMGHTSCGAVKGACDNVQMGNLTGLLAKIMPAVAAVPNNGKDRSSKNYEFVEMVAEQNVRQNVQLIRDRSPILKEMEDKGEVKIVGAMYDVASGRVTWYE
jgi:carbonic anhydrase